jgi:hypothetical protein
MTDNVAVLDGFTKEITIETKDRLIFALVRPGTKFAGTYRAWDMDNQEYVTIAGRGARWNVAFGEVTK